MKTKISLVLLKISDKFDPFGESNVRILVDENENVPYKYISTKTVNDTLQELLFKYTNLDVRYCRPSLVGFEHEEKSTECEAIYTVRIPDGIVSLKLGRFATIPEINLKDYYAGIIQQSPRSVY